MSGFTFPSSSSSSQSSSFGIGSTASAFGFSSRLSFGSSAANPSSTSSSSSPLFGVGLPGFSSSSPSSPLSFGSSASTGSSSFGASLTAAVSSAPFFSGTTSSASTSSFPFFGVAASSGSPLFGATIPSSRSASSSSLFGVSSAAASSSSPLFGSSAPASFGPISAPFFGASSSAASSAPGFGAPSSAASSGSTLFGTPSSAASSGSALFGTTSSAASSGSSLFCAPSSAASSGSSIFGAASTKATSTPSLFGASSAPSTSIAPASPAFRASSLTTSSPSFENIASSSSSLNTSSALPFCAAASEFSFAKSTPSSTSKDVSAAAPSLTPSSSNSPGFSLGIPASSSTKSSSGFGNDGSSASAAKVGTGVPTFGVSSSSATTALSVAAPAIAAAASGDVSSSTGSGHSTGSFTGFLPSTKTSATASSSQVQSKSASPVFDAEVKRSYKRDLPPAHFMFKIESFSLLSEAEVEKYETDAFEVGGYKWSLIFYPNGNKNADIDDHISLYLAIKEIEKLPACWEVNATFKFFVFDHIRDKYFTVEGCKGSMKRFHALKTEWGFAQFLSLESLKNASTGYLVGDSCIFGAEVFVVKSSCKVECLSMIKYTCNNLMTWKIEDFSKLDKESYESEVFDVGGSKWKLRLYPKGERLGKVRSLSLYLCRTWNETVSLAPSHKLFAHYKLRIRNQIQDSDHVERIGKRWFDSSSLSWGYMDYISLQDLKNPVKGLLVKDCLIVEAEFLYVSKVKSLS